MGPKSGHFCLKALSTFAFTLSPSSFMYKVYCSDLLKLKIFHQITQENPGSKNI
uniref:Uncharacterized protein n=1 Tax=Monodon monoceros TaxID=40151 RepID=A0A8C6F8E0_MONMO